MPAEEQHNQELNDTLLETLRRSYPRRTAMKNLVNKELNKAMVEVSKIDGAYTLSKSIANEFLVTANIELSHVKKFASFIPGGLVMSNPFYNTLLIYILTFCASGEVDSVVYSISQYFTAIKLSYAKKKYFPVINADLLNYTLTNGHGSTVARQGWAALVEKVSRETLDKYIDTFRSRVSLYSYYRYMVDVHNKINQSVKHIARRYYANSGKIVSSGESELINAALSALDRVSDSPQAVDYISRAAGVNEFEVENIITKLKRESDDTSHLQSIIASFIKQYKNRDGINRVGIAIAAGRGALITGVSQNAEEALKGIGEDPTRDSIRIVIYIALLCIMYSSA